MVLGLFKMRYNMMCFCFLLNFLCRICVILTAVGVSTLLVGLLDLWISFTHTFYSSCLICLSWLLEFGEKLEL